MERRKMKKKGFTLVELLVVIAIIAMLLAILMPALGKVRQMAQRIMCATNLSGIGKALLIYSNDDSYERFAVGGGGNLYDTSGTMNCPGGAPVSVTTESECSWDWGDKTADPSKNTPAGPGNGATISSSLFLLIKYADVGPDQFICPGGEQAKFDMAPYDDAGAIASGTNSYVDLWDFGGAAALPDNTRAGIRRKGHQSYAYQMPYSNTASENTPANYGVYVAGVTTLPSQAIMADRNPFCDSTVTDPEFYPNIMEWDTSKPKPSTVKRQNSGTHQRDGQNVLYADYHVKFEKSANCSVELDNIYTVWDPAETSDLQKKKQIGELSRNPDFHNSASKTDSYLVNDPS